VYEAAKKSVFLLKEKVREIEEKKIDYRVKFTTEPNVIIGCLFVHVYIYIYIYMCVCAFACARLPARIGCIWILSIVVLKVR